MARRRSGGVSDTVMLIIIAVIIAVSLLSMITFAPGIVVASIINAVKPLTTGPLWGTTLVATIMFLLLLYFISKEGFIKLYLFIAIAIFLIGFIYTLFDDTNFIYGTVKKMYHFIAEKK